MLLLPPFAQSPPRIQALSGKGPAPRTRSPVCRAPPPARIFRGGYAPAAYLPEWRYWQSMCYLTVSFRGKCSTKLNNSKSRPVCGLQSEMGCQFVLINYGSLLCPLRQRDDERQKSSNFASCAAQLNC